MDRIQMIEKKIELKEKLSEDEINYYISVSENDPKKLYKIGELYYYGRGVKRDYQEAMGYFEQAAKLGNAEALNSIAYMYEWGIGVIRNIPKAIECFEQAIKLGSDDALFNLGSMYENGEGVEKSLPKAIEYYEHAAELGVAAALYSLGDVYKKGEGVEVNLQKANEYYERAREIYEKDAELGDVDALCDLACMYKKGEGVEVNLQKAFELFKKAAELGDVDALYDLGDMYKKGEGVEQNLPKAEEYYERVAEFGDADSLYALADMYENGEGVEINLQKAFELYKKAAELGDVDALHDLGNMYENGEGVEINLQKAFELYKKAAELGDVDALYNLGNMYQHGEGVEQDFTKALEYYKQAAEKGSDISKICLLNHRFLNGEKSVLGELFDAYTRYHDKDLYSQKIKSLIDNGSEVLYFEKIDDLFNIRFISDDCNKNVRISIKSVLDFLNGQSDDTIIFLGSNIDWFNYVCQDFYTVSDLKKIVEVCRNLVGGIDFNQKEEDVVTQLYIKLGRFVHYDDLAVGDQKDERFSISRNLTVFLTREGVCHGISVALKFIVNLCGRDCDAFMSKSGEHVYNQLKINGKWYNCDLTWDSGLMKDLLISNFLQSKTNFSQSFYHQPMYAAQEHEASEDYPNVGKLFMSNYNNLFPKGLYALKKMFQNSIVHSGVLEDGGRTR